MVSEATKQAIRQLQKIYPNRRSALIPALHLAQREEGFLSLETEKEMASLFDICVNEVHAIVSFYDMFFEKPVGKHLIHVCKNVSCMLRGSDNLLSTLCDRLQVKPGETTTDGQFTLIASECLAACDKAPMLLGDDEVFGPIQPDEIDAVLNAIQSKKGHPSPVDIDEESYDG